MRVLLACNSPRVLNSGVAGTMMNVASGLRDLGWDTHEMFVNARFSSRVERQLMYLRVAGGVAHAHPDIAIVSSGDGALVPFVRPKVPLVFESHGLERLANIAAKSRGLPNPYSGRGHLMIRERAISLAMRNARAIVVKNRLEREYIARMGSDFDRKTVLIPNGVEGSLLNLIRDEYQSPIVTWIGSWLPRKGITWLPALADRLVSMRPDVELRLLGTGVDARTVLSTFDSSVRSRVAVYPSVSREELREHLSVTWVGLFTSNFEGFGNVVPEMMASGLPVVSTNVGASADYLHANQNGVLVDWGDADGGARAVAGLLDSGSKRRALGQTARRDAHQLEWSRVLYKWNDLLVRVAGELHTPQ